MKTTKTVKHIGGVKKIEEEIQLNQKKSLYLLMILKRMSEMKKI